MMGQQTTMLLEPACPSSTADDVANLQRPVFDYAELANDVAEEARATAERIRTRLEASYIDTGRDLLAIKERLGHGHFGKWLAAEFNMNVRTAERYMGAARLAETKPDIVSNLPPTVVYAIAAAPPEAQERIEAFAKQGTRISAKIARIVIADVKDELERAQAEANLTDKQRKRIIRKKAQIARESERCRREEEERRQQQERAEGRVVEIIVGAMTDERLDELEAAMSDTYWKSLARKIAQARQEARAAA